MKLRTALASLAAVATLGSPAVVDAAHPALSSCSRYVSRTSTQVVMTTRCTSGIGRQKASLTVRTASGVYLHGTGNCVGINGYSTTAVTVPSDQSGPNSATWSGGPVSC